MKSDDLVSDLKHDEGLRLKPYRDSAGKLTIGYGRNLDDVGISEIEAEALLVADIAVAEHELDRALPWWRDLPGAASAALANMAFNLGITRLLSFRRMLAALNTQDFETAAAEALDSKWAHQVGDRAERIATLYRSASKQQR